LINPKIYDLFVEGFQIIISGGEPTLYKEFKELCDGLENRNVCIYSNISDFAYNKLCSLEKPVKIYPSYHSKMEIEKHGKDAFRAWYRRLLDLRLCGHQIYTAHSPNDKSPEVQELSNWVLKTRIEGVWQGEFYSPFVNECRSLSKEMRTVRCYTQHFVVASDGDIYNCQGNLWSKREGTVIANIQDVNWSEFPEMVECEMCGACHICSQMKAITELDGTIIKDEWQYKPLLDQIIKKRKAA
jgi:sulfatase maturation enzyme AslB (radical SAM superfamily)